LTEEVLSIEKLEEIGERALTFQRFIYRRAWGTYYVVWSVAFVVFGFAGALPLQDLAPQSLSWVPYALVYGGTGWGAGIATAWIFRKAYRASFLRSAMGTSPPGRRGRRWTFSWLFWVAYYVIILVAFNRYPDTALPFLFASTLVVELFIYWMLKLSFPDGIPAEGRVALLSYGAAVVYSFFVSLLLPQNFVLLGSGWLAVTVVWFFCAFYALRHAPDELVELRD
jgi:hypothetical protein